LHQTGLDWLRLLMPSPALHCSTLLSSPSPPSPPSPPSSRPLFRLNSKYPHPRPPHSLSLSFPSGGAHAARSPSPQRRRSRPHISPVPHSGRTATPTKVQEAEFVRHRAWLFLSLLPPTPQFPSLSLARPFSFSFPFAKDVGRLVCSIASPVSGRCKATRGRSRTES